MTNKFIVCDQIFSSKETLLDNFNMFSKEKALQVCIYRDPRDQFFSAYKHQLMDTCIGIDEFVNFYKYKLGLYQMMNTPNKNRVMIRFEDLVLKYNETTQKIMEFCGINPADHIAPKSVFDPAISAVNIGAWRNFIDQDVMRQIEEKLGEYCYYPEQEHLSEEAWALLKATR